MTILEAEATVIRFGIHKGATLGAIARREVDYLDYLLTCQGLGRYFAEALALVAEKHGRKPKAIAQAEGQLRLF